ncbi:MAG: PadR family transcriptional regulator [Thermodesulfobacteriota bacterium]
MLRDLELAFIRLHILHHAQQDEVFGVGLMKELARHGYAIGAGTLYPLLAKLEGAGLLTCRPRAVGHKQRKYYRITPQGRRVLRAMRAKTKELYQELLEE